MSTGVIRREEEEQDLYRLSVLYLRNPYIACGTFPSISLLDEAMVRGDPVEVMLNHLGYMDTRDNRAYVWTLYWKLGEFLSNSVVPFIEDHYRKCYEPVVGSSL